MRAHAASQVYESPLFYQYLSMYSSDCFQGREGEEQSVLPTNYLSFAHVQNSCVLSSIPVFLIENESMYFVYILIIVQVSEE